MCFTKLACCSLSSVKQGIINRCFPHHHSNKKKNKPATNQEGDSNNNNWPNRAYNAVKKASEGLENNNPASIHRSRQRKPQPLPHKPTLRSRMPVPVRNRVPANSVSVSAPQRVLAGIDPTLTCLIHSAARASASTPTPARPSPPRASHSTAQRVRGSRRVRRLPGIAEEGPEEFVWPIWPAAATPKDIGRYFPPMPAGPPLACREDRAGESEADAKGKGKGKAKPEEIHGDSDGSDSDSDEEEAFKRMLELAGIERAEQDRRMAWEEAMMAVEGSSGEGGDGRGLN